MLKIKKIFWVLITVVLLLVVSVPLICFAVDGDEDVVYGDLSGDGHISLLDVVKMRELLANEGVNVSGGEDDPADVNCDGFINLMDLAMLRNYIASYNYSAGTSKVVFGEDKASSKYTSGDGAVTSFYDNADSERYNYTCSSYSNSGYSVYCSNTVGGLSSTTYIKDDEVHTVTFNSELRELYITRSDSGAGALPTIEESYIWRNETTVTQNGSANINGMSYIVKLADGSFIVYDGGYASAYNTGTENYSDDAKNLYNKLLELNGGANDIHIRAWLITHSHGDHYRTFKYFANYYAGKVTLDTLLCSPVSAGVAEYDSYLTVAVKNDAKKFGADIAYIRTGMEFQLADVTLEILITPEQIYNVSDPGNFNESSVVSRIKNTDGSMMFLGDCGENVSNWLIETYGDALKSDMVQVAHHGCETATAELYDKIAAPVAFWPCSVALLTSERGPVKQHILESEYSMEHILHGYGTATRALSYRPAASINVLPSSIRSIKGSDFVSGLRFENGVLKYEVKARGTDTLDPNISFKVSGVTANKYNVVKLVIGTDDARYVTAENKDTFVNSAVFFKTSGESSTLGSGYDGNHSRIFYPQGIIDTVEDDRMTIIVYLGDVSGYNGTITELRIDLGYEVGQTVEIYSVEMYYVDID